MSLLGRRDPRRSVLLALMVTTALASLDGTVVTTAVPSIVRSLGGFGLFPWLFSIYLLTQVVTVPIYGRMADLFGRKRVLFVGIGTFLVGSVLCGVAPSMVLLIVFRGLQGIGTGAIIPTMYTVVGDLYSAEERARVQGYISSVFGISSIMGPLVGGALTEFVDWRWIFYVNVPIGLAALVMLNRGLHESIEKRKHVIDWLGGATLTAALSLIVFALLQGGSHWRWTSSAELIVLGLGAAMIAIFALVEKLAPEPIIESWVVANRPMAASFVANFAVGAVTIGMTSYVPTYVQGVRHLGPIVGGLTVAASSLGWPLASGNSGKLYLRFGFRTAVLVGGFCCILGTALFSTLGATTPIPLVAVFGLITGLGFGFIATPVLVAMQSLVGWERRGVVTGSVNFSRSLGSTLGVALLGSIANSTLAGWLSHPPSTVSGSLPHTVDAASRVLGNKASTLSPAATSYVREGLLHATHGVFLGLLGCAVVSTIALFCIPRKLSPLQLGEAQHTPLSTSEAVPTKPAVT